MARSYYVLTGPTAAGKTELLLRAAGAARLLVISADSRQVYRGMDIGTGKATALQRARQPHRVIDVAEPGEVFSAFHFVRHAATALREAEEQGRVAWVCGGTGLYIRALAEQLEFGSAPRPRLRAAIAEVLRERAAPAVAKELGVDLRESANPARVMRAIENACAEKVRKAELYAGLGLAGPDLAEDDAVADRQRLSGDTAEELQRWSYAGVYVLDPGKAELEQAIRRRVEGMFAGGLLDEVQRLRAAGFGDTAVVSQGIGYREAGEVLDGRLALGDAGERTVIRTRQYAKRQRTYYRGQGWPVASAEEIAAAIRQSLGATSG